jgi:hypothetical protein
MYTQILTSMNMIPGETELFHANRQMDRRDEACSRFSQFCEKRLGTIHSLYQCTLKCAPIHAKKKK